MMLEDQACHDDVLLKIASLRREIKSHKPLEDQIKELQDVSARRHNKKRKFKTRFSLLS